MPKHSFVVTIEQDENDCDRCYGLGENTIGEEIHSNLESVWPCAAVSVVSGTFAESWTKARAVLDDIATSDGLLRSDDIIRLCAARAMLASLLGLPYNDETKRFTPCR